MKLTFALVAGFAAAVVALLLTHPAYAYLDPGTGSALIQGLIASIAALGLTLKVYWHRVIGFLGSRSKTPTETDDASLPVTPADPPSTGVPPE